MDYAVVSTKRSSLKVYTTSNTAEKNAIGSIPTGTSVEVLDHRVVNNVEWVKVKSNEISGWAILKHPSVSYYYLEAPVAIMSESTTNIYNSAVIRQTSKADVSYSIIKDNNGGETVTLGEVPDIARNTSFASTSVQHPTLSNVEKFKFDGQRKSDNSASASRDLPSNVQNDKGYPYGVYNSELGRYQYDYSTDYSQNEFITAVNELKNSINIHEESSVQLYDRYSKYYNRFKVATPDDVLTKTFAHVFFTRPDCNLIYSNGSEGYVLMDQVANNPDYIREKRNNPGTLIQLSQDVGLNHQFMMLPSNRITSFECRDRSIKNDTYGRTRHGYSIAYGRHIDDSLAASEVSISFTDDRDLHLFRMHQLWVEYISAVNKGRLLPKQTYMINKCLDYACSAYYIVCAENGEDIIYWSKLYGVFPTNIPDSIMTWSKSQFITNPEISITYQYSWKKDWNSSIISEFNLNSDLNNTKYLQSYDPNILSTGNTWVGAPFIEMVKDNVGRTIYKLRFRQN